MALELESQGLFAARGVQVLYTGIGKVNAAYRLTRAIAEHRAEHGAAPRVVNFGTVGSPTLGAGSVVACRRFVQRDMDVSGLGFPLGTTPFEDVPAVLEFPALFPELPEAVCGTGDRFETGKPLVDCDVIDMEGYALAKVCHLESVELGAVKFVTDGADGTAGVDWQDNLPRAARAFVEHYDLLLAR
ncbi:MAG: 5'-nucleosidase [Myxococcales bacterium]|nr:MAG: 5'-nucleosidase [Myxococcales bacterium]